MATTLIYEGEVFGPALPSFDLDLCDADHVSKAQVRYQDEDGREFDLCGHHSRQHHHALLRAGYRLAAAREGN